VQSRVAEEAEAGAALQAGGLEAQFGEGITGGDIWGWFRSLFDRIDKKEWHDIKRPVGDTPGTIADKGRVAVVGDWGTNLYGAPVSARSIRKAGGYELMLHLGDIYYSGTKTETRQRFLDAWPTGAARMNRALNGNHEMYSGGFAYFDDILPKFDQEASYFALQNSNWLLIGLDTAHSDHDLDGKQVSWIKTAVKNAGQRKVILFSHHQPFSRLDIRARRPFPEEEDHGVVLGPRARLHHLRPASRHRHARPLHRAWRHPGSAQDGGHGCAGLQAL
jgi:Calcineurin-like phosphoesterase